MRLPCKKTTGVLFAVSKKVCTFAKKINHGKEANKHNHSHPKK